MSDLDSLMADLEADLDADAPAAASAASPPPPIESSTPAAAEQAAGEDDPLSAPAAPTVADPLQAPSPPIAAAEPEPEPDAAVDDEIDDLADELEELVAPAAAAPPVEAEEGEGVLISPFGPAAEDNSVKATLKAALTTRDGPGLTAALDAAAASMQTDEGRTALREMLEEGNTKPQLDKRTFENLTQVFEAALRCVLEHYDMQNASVYLSMLNTYYRLTPGGAASRLAEEEAIRQSPVWSNLEFWKGSVFEVLAQKRTEMAAEDTGVGPEKFADMDEMQIKQQEEMEQLVAFEQVQKIMTQMLEFGQVSLEDVVKFRNDMEQLDVLTIPDYLEQLDNVLATSAKEHILDEFPRGMGTADWESSPHSKGGGSSGEPTCNAYGFPVQHGEEGLYLKECLWFESNPLPDDTSSAWDEWLKAHASDPKLRVGTRLVQSGIPHEMRARAWTALTREARAEIEEYLGKITYADHVKDIGVEESPGRSKDL